MYLEEAELNIFSSTDTDKIQEMTAGLFSCLTQDTRPETQPSYVVSKFSVRHLITQTGASSFH